MSRRRRGGLMARFGLVSLIPVVLLGFVLGRAIRDSIEDRALDVYTAESEVVLNLFVRNLLTEADFAAPMAEDRADVLRSLLAQIPATEGIEPEIRIVNHDGLVVFSTDRDEIGRLLAVEPFAGALAGVSHTEFSGSARAGGETYRLLRLHQAIRLTPGGEVLGAVEVVAADTTVAPVIGSDVRRIQLTLGAGLAVLWLSLLPIAWRAGRALRRQAEQNEHLALHDALTGLPNRVLFSDRLSQAVASARRSGRRGGLLVLDLNGFKEVNDSLGHHHGDVLLRHAAEVLSGALREVDTVARLGGDEFAIVLADVEDRFALAEVAGRLSRALDQPVSMDGVSVVVGASMGGVVFPDDGDEVVHLLQRADAAMYAAKRSGSPFQPFTAVTAASGRSKLTLVADLRDALATGQGLTVHYQPRVTAGDGRPVAMEAMLRWEHPVLGPLESAQFLAAAEHGGLVRDLTMRVIDLAVADCRDWVAAGLDLSVAVNLPARNLREHDLPERVGAVLARHRVAASRLVVETTEAALLAGPQGARERVARLRALGVRLVLDDFGTAASSLGALRMLPVDQLKIDRAFVHELTDGAAAESIVRSVVALAHDLGIGVTAEGVDAADQHERLVAMRCDFVQGWHVNGPLRPRQVVAWARERSAVGRRQR